MSILTLLQDAADDLGLTRPTAIIASNDLTNRQLFAMAKKEAEELAKSFNWQALTEEKTFVTVAAAAQTDTPVAADFDRFIPNTFYNRTTMRPVVGPVTPQVWQAIQANPAVGRIVLGFRQRDGSFLITPTPTAGQTIGYEYISAYYAKSAGGTAQSTWIADTDLSYLPERLIRLGVIWRWRQRKGFPYDEDHDTYTRAVAVDQARDGGSTILPYVGADGCFPYDPQVPQTGFGV